MRRKRRNTLDKQGHKNKVIYHHGVNYIFYCLTIMRCVCQNQLYATCIQVLCTHGS